MWLTCESNDNEEKLEVNGHLAERVVKNQPVKSEFHGSPYCNTVFAICNLPCINSKELPLKCLIPLYVQSPVTVCKFLKQTSIGQKTADWLQEPTYLMTFDNTQNITAGFVHISFKVLLFSPSVNRATKQDWFILINFNESIFF